MSPPHRGFVVLAVLALCAALSGCSGSSSATSTGSPPAEGYLFAGTSELIYVGWHRDDTPITGTVDWRRAGSARVAADFTITMGDGSFSFNFAPGTIAGWTGSYAGDGLELVIPADGGGLRTIALRPASQADFEQLAAQLH